MFAIGFSPFRFAGGKWQAHLGLSALSRRLWVVLPELLGMAPGEPGDTTGGKLQLPLEQRSKWEHAEDHQRIDDCPAGGEDDTVRLCDPMRAIVYEFGAEQGCAAMSGYPADAAFSGKPPPDSGIADKLIDLE
jgi:hypothetical protein